MTDGRTDELILPDQRRLTFRDIGTGKSGVWIHCHGIPGSRNELGHLEADLVRAGVRVITPDRPGYGGSSPLAGQHLSTFVEDLNHLANHLALERFYLSGFSGGGVFALVAAAMLPDRIAQLVLAATPAAPFMDRPLAHVSELTANAWQAAETGAAPLADMLKALTASSADLAAGMVGAADEEEQRYLTSSRVMPAIERNMQTAVAQGAEPSASAMAVDTFEIIHPWPVDPASIGTPTRIVHGENDALVKATHQDALAGRMPRASVERVPHAGHYTVLPAVWGL